MAENNADKPTAEGNKELSLEAANRLLGRIGQAASGTALSADDLKHLADAYATVVDAMPKPKSQGRGAVFS